MNHYEALMERVLAIDRDAGEYLAGEAMRLPSFRREWSVARCFDWLETPQGWKFWHLIHLEESKLT